MGGFIKASEKQEEQQQKKKGFFANQKLMASKPRMVKPVVETVQDSLPVFTVHENYNIIESYPGCYTKTYKIDNINYSTSTEDEQDVLLQRWRALLNSLGNKQDFALTIFNRPVDLRRFNEEVLLKETGDGYDYLRRQLNQILTDRQIEGKNGITRDTYITIGVHADNLHKAVAVYKAYDSGIDKQLKTLGSCAKVMPIEERLEILHDIYNLNNRGEFLTKTKVYNPQTGNTEEFASFDFDNIRSMGITVNDVIGPSSIQYYPKYIRIGTQYARALKVTAYSTSLSDDFLTEVTNMNFNMLTTFNVKALTNYETDRLINSQLAYVREEKNNIQIRNRKNNVSEDMLPPETIEKENEILKLRDQIRENDEHLFATCLTFVIFAPNEELLEEYTDNVISECKKVSVTADILEDQQEEGFITTLPLCVNTLKVQRTLKSSSVAVIQPFSNLEINEKGGINYTMNAVSKNMIIFNRLTKPNQNGFILGSSGCVDAETEYFNGTEWKSIADYTEGEEVLQYEEKTNKVSLALPEAYISKPCDKMIRFANDKIDMTLSEEHRVLYYDKEMKSHVVYASEFARLIKVENIDGYIRVGEHGQEFADISDLGVNIFFPKDRSKYCFTMPADTLVLRRNGKIFVTKNSGKSFTAKSEIVNVFLGQNSDIMIIDPEQEYCYITTALNGQVIPIMPGGEYHINPLDISTSYEFDESSKSITGGETVDPILEKVSFIMKLFESMVSESWGMDSIQKTLIDECLRDLYAPFMQNGRLYRAPKFEETPTFNNMREWLSRRKEPEARTLYYVLSRYAGDGTLNLFSQHTNVQIHNRIVNFDISSVGEELKLMAMQIIQDAMWSRLVENRKLGKRTYIYVDECHLFFQPGNESASEFLTALWKRARKYGGAPTGITQSPADLLEHPTGKRLLSECNFIQILNQSSDENRERLKNILDLSDSAIEFITNAPIGQGLFYTGVSTVPFFSRFPMDNDIFPMLTSDMTQLKEIEEKKRREAAKAAQEEKKAAFV